MERLLIRILAFSVLQSPLAESYSVRSLERSVFLVIVVRRLRSRQSKIVAAKGEGRDCGVGGGLEERRIWSRGRVGAVRY